MRCRFAFGTKWSGVDASCVDAHVSPTRAPRTDLRRSQPVHERVAAGAFDDGTAEHAAAAGGGGGGGAAALEAELARVRSEHVTAYEVLE